MEELASGIHSCWCLEKIDCFSSAKEAPDLGSDGYAHVGPWLENPAFWLSAAHRARNAALGNFFEAGSIALMLRITT